ncbi:MAG: hypothetical protein RL172_1526 [Bacteroidota bacterium]|jgi:hypothetical protein
MTNSTQTNDFLDFNEGGKPALPSALNVLTILTFIGCAVEVLGSVWRFFTAEKSYKQLQEAQGKMENAPAWAKGMMSPEMLEVSRKAMENKLILLVITLAGTALCLWGAMEMRKLKKQGYLLWVVGEFLPILGGVIIVGTGMLSGFSMFVLVFPIIFLILYTVNKKHLLY